MSQASDNGVEIEFETWGVRSGQPLLLVGGLGTRIITWVELLVQALVDVGLFVIAYDNRDIGLSMKFDDWGSADIKAAFKQTRAKQKVDAPYTLEDMADDAAVLLDYLEIECVNIVGNSNGGAIAQTLAIRHPEKTATLISMMSTSGRRGLARPSEAASEWLARPRNPAGTRDGAIQEAVETSHIIGSPGSRRDESAIREKAGRLFGRSFYPAGNSRQLLASIASGDARVEGLGEITAPTLVLHGRDDPLVPLACAEDVRDSIPGAEMLVVDGMGHDFPAMVIPIVASGISDFVVKQ